MEESPEFTSQLIQMLWQEQDKSNQMLEQMEAVSVKSEYFDLFMETDTLTNIRNTAKEIRIPEKLFTHLLEEMGFVYRHCGSLCAIIANRVTVLHFTGDVGTMSIKFMDDCPVEVT